MKNTFLFALVACLSPYAVFAQTVDDSVIVRINGIFVDEIIDGGDEGFGGTAEFALIVGESSGLLQTVGLEVGYIDSDTDDFEEVEIDTYLIPIFANFAVRGGFEDSGFVWEAGVGLGGVFADFDVSTTESGSEDDDDFVFGGQLFSRIGYNFADSILLSAGIRYMLAEDPDYPVVDVDDLLNSVAFDVGLSFVF